VRFFLLLWVVEFRCREELLEIIMQVRNRIYNGTLYIVLSGELDEHSAQSVRISLDELFDESKFNQVIIDLSELDFMDSTGIGVLLGRYKKLKAKNTPIFICNPSSHAEKIFKMTGLYEIMPKIS
jgi:stage II sporulation protein AA (anti-sigma F factor antagonist)